MKKRYFIILLISLFVFIPFNVEARENDVNDYYADCTYKDKKYDITLRYYYNVTTKEFDFTTSGNDMKNRIIVRNDVIESNFFNTYTDGSLFCPAIYIDVGNKSNYPNEPYISIYNKKTGIARMLAASEAKINKPSSESSASSSQKTCVYEASTGTVQYIIDTEKKTILSSKLDGEKVSNPFTYDEIWTGDGCNDDLELYRTCNNGTCSITKEKQTGDKVTSVQLTINEKKSTGVQKEYEYNQGEEVSGCEVIPDSIQKWIKILLNFIKYIALVLVIILGTIDFIKAASSGEPDAVKKAGQSFLKRVVAVILLFLLPIIVELILNLINLYGATDDCFNISQ